MYTKDNRYRSWSDLKKRLSGFLCDALKDRVTYYYTSYRSVHSTYGRAAIRCDQSELFTCSWDTSLDVQWRDECAAWKAISPQEKATMEDPWGVQIEIYNNLMQEKWMPDGTLSDHDFIRSALLYLQSDISTALASNNYLLRVFAFLDRRTGKRTLIRIQEDVAQLPEWVQQFYRIRCQAEGIGCMDNPVTIEQ